MKALPDLQHEVLLYLAGERFTRLRSYIDEHIMGGPILPGRMPATSRPQLSEALDVLAGKGLIRVGHQEPGNPTYYVQLARDMDRVLQKRMGADTPRDREHVDVFLRQLLAELP